MDLVYWHTKGDGSYTIGPIQMDRFDVNVYEMVPSLPQAGTKVFNLGFKTGRSTIDITTLMRELLSSGAAWGVRVFICSQDILTAFHAIPHEVIVAALLHLGVHAHLIRAFMLQLTGVQATMQIAGAGPSKGFAYISGGKQGVSRHLTCSMQSWNT